MNREYVVKTSNNFFKNRFEKSFDRSNLVVRQVKMSDKQEVIQWPKDNMSNSFGFFSFKLPLIFSFLSQLNYVLFLLMGELFGSFFYNISNFSYNFFQILRYFETVDLS